MIQIVYISSPENNQIYVWKLDINKEKLELMQIVSTLGYAQPITIHSNKKFLYTGIRPNFRIDTYRIDSEGLLHKVNSIDILHSPTYLTINATNTFLYCASYNHNSINVIAINKSGLPIGSVQIIENLLGCHSANINLNDTLLLAPCLKEDTIRVFNINQYNGKLIPYDPYCIITAIKSGPRHMIFHNSENYAYVINELNGTINVISLDYLEKKISTIIQTIKILPSNNLQIKQFWAADVHMTPNNSWLYCSDRATHIISCFRVSAENKKLSFVNYQYTELQPRGFAIDTTGRFLIVAGQRSHHISLYRININTGSLYILSRYKSGTGPMWINILSHKNLCE